ncbi:MAG: hypothetical protein E7574_07105 [Ruminococcaceae bacterium]|nr:hypothetical protein [Oscillospiraceae bacterium]
MSLLNNDNATANRISQKALLERKYEGARGNILLVIILTLINIIFLVAKTGTYFLFSAYVPYFFADFGMLVCGMYPSEFYVGQLSGIEFLPKYVFVITLVIAAVIIALYFLSWMFSKKHKVGWLVFALIFFSLDTLAMFVINGFFLGAIIDYVMHAWVIFSLVTGISAHLKLKKLPADEILEAEAVELTQAEVVEEVTSESTETTVFAELEENSTEEQLQSSDEQQNETSE